YRYLHSFPTRRSSDLSVPEQLYAPGSDWLLYEMIIFLFSHSLLFFQESCTGSPSLFLLCLPKGPDPARQTVPVPARLFPFPHGRSAEHTSELQSRFDL